MKIWELHGRQLNGAIRGTPDGEADVAGLIFSEKAYLLALRDFRPSQLVNMVHNQGPADAARKLIEHFSDADGRGLVTTRGMTSSWPMVKRSDEVSVPAPPGKPPGH
jgi:hypothetical protein